jgi:hypothetical protein
LFISFTIKFFTGASPSVGLKGVRVTHINTLTSYADRILKAPRSLKESGPGATKGEADAKGKAKIGSGNKESMSKSQKSAMAPPTMKAKMSESPIPDAGAMKKDMKKNKSNDVSAKVDVKDDKMKKGKTMKPKAITWPDETDGNEDGNDNSSGSKSKYIM